MGSLAGKGQPPTRHAFATGVKASAKTGSIEEAGFELVWDYHEGPAQSFDTRTDYLEQHDERAEKRDIATRR